MVFEDKPNQVHFYDIDRQEEYEFADDSEQKIEKKISFHDEKLGFLPDLDENGQIIVNDKLRMRSLDSE